jgi:transposase InsO family protein
MEAVKLDVLLEPERTGDSVAEVCRRRGISRQTYYVYRRRYLAEGVAGLRPRSRRPRSSPGQIVADLESVLCSLRKRHPRWGARRLRAELARLGIDPPAVSTIHQALKRNYLVAPQPQRPRKARKRFEREVANDLWQIDATQVKLAQGGTAWVVDCLDDHARFLLSALACPAPTGEAAWTCFMDAAAGYGLPRQLLSDNHTSFTGRRFGVTVAFERKLAQVGVQLINAAPAHPQTLGKLERFHRTLKEWLEDEGPAVDLDQLQLLLDRFRPHYKTPSVRIKGSATKRPPTATAPSGRVRSSSRRSPTASVSRPTPRTHSHGQCGRTASRTTGAWGSSSASASPGTRPHPRGRRARACLPRRRAPACSCTGSRQALPTP